MLSEADAENASVYQANANAAIARLDSLVSEISKETESLGDLRFIVFHDAYQYFENRFDISATGAISVSDAQDPSAARVAEIRDKVETLNVTCVFTEPQFNSNLVDSIFEGVSTVNVGIMDPIGVGIPLGKDHYNGLIKKMANSLNECI